MSKIDFEQLRIEQRDRMIANSITAQVIDSLSEETREAMGRERLLSTVFATVQEAAHRAILEERKHHESDMAALRHHALTRLATLQAHVPPGMVVRAEGTERP